MTAVFMTREEGSLTARTALPSMRENAELPGRPRGEHMIVKHAAVNSYCGGGSDLAPEAWTSWRRRILIARRKRKLQLHDGRLLGMG